MVKPKVSIVDARGREVFDCVKQAIDLIGGIGRFVKPGNLVLIKPNMFIAQRDHTTGETTDPRVTIAVAKLAKDAGGKVVVAERTQSLKVGFEPFPEIYEYAKVVSIDDLPFHHGFLFGAQSLSSMIPIPDIIDECDVFINIPGLRTHMLPLMSNGMKNLMGLMQRNYTGYVHKFGLEGSVVDINYHRPSDLVVTDAIYSLQGNFPGKAWPAVTDVVMASDNVVAADTVAAVAIGFDPSTMDYLVEADSRGMGPNRISDIEIVGESLEFAKERIVLEQTEKSYEPYKDKVTILDRGACPRCKRGLIGGLRNLELTDPDTFAKLRADEITILVGPFEEEPEIKTKDVFLYGNCTYKYRHLGLYQFGCCPLAGQAASGLKKIISQRQPIKISYCTLGMKSQKIEDVLRKVAEIGYDGVELWMPHLDEYAERNGELGSLKKLMDDLKLKAEMIVPYFKLTGSEEDRQSSFETAKKAIERAELFGTNKVRAFVGGPGSKEATQEHWDLAVKALRVICDMSPKTLFALETHDNQLQDTIATTLKLLRKVGRNNLKVNLDVFNLFIEGDDPVDSLEHLFPAVVNIHAKNRRTKPDGRKEACYLEDGDMSYSAFFERLKALGYTGPVSIEWFGGDPEGAAKHEYDYLSRVLKKA